MRISPPPSVAESDWTAVDASDSPVGISLSADHKSCKVLVTLTPPAVEPRAPMDICCVIDVSGSMGTEAPVPGDGGENERTGLSVLDIVKHSLRTIIATMKSTDRLALVTFTDSASVAAGLTEMTDEGKKAVLSTIEGLIPLSSTNLWDGLKTGMNLLDDAYNSSSSTTSTIGRLPTLFLLTDGMPNIEPPRGHIPMLKSYLDAHPVARGFSISTFGFGYDLDSALLLQIAQVGGGGYSFIPDAGMVGTVFVHSAANAYATYAPRATLNIEVPDGVQVGVKGAVGSGEVKRTSWGVTIDAGDIQFGQTRDYVLAFPDGKIPPDFSATATFRPFSSASPLKTDTITLTQGANPPDLVTLEHHTARLSLVEALFIAIRPKADLGASRSALAALERSITSSPLLATHAPSQALAADISGQGTIGLEAKHFQRWGRHYFPSLARSHARQQCANFKDPGLQVYGKGSRVFERERDELSETFDKLPPPKPSVSASHTYPAYGGRGGRSMGAAMLRAQASPAPRRGVSSMAMYQRSAGPCFTGASRVLLADGTSARVDTLKRGVDVMTLCGPRVIAAVVRTHVDTGEALLCELGDGLAITPWHPVVHASKWVFPADLISAQMQLCNAVYSLLLLPSTDVDAHTVSIGGVWCVTLGHGLTAPSAHGDVRAHAYLGSYDRVLMDLSKMGGFEGEGIVRCVRTRRDVDGKICGFAGTEEGANERTKNHGLLVNGGICRSL